MSTCGANVATLVVARTATRQREIAVRTALGASRARVSAQLVIEALVLCAIAVVAGLGAASAGGRWVERLLTQAFQEPPPFWWDAALRPETVVYALSLAVFAALIVGLCPALNATGPSLHGKLREAEDRWDEAAG